jgi:dUTP pyrophosphatase
MAGQIDSGYRGSIFVSLYNGNDVPVEISKSISEVEKTEDFIRVPKSKAIAQFAMEEVPQMNIKEVTYEELLTIESERGIGSLGSSNK